MTLNILTKAQSASDKQEKSAWPILPLAALATVFIGTWVAGIRAQWAINFCAFMIAFSVAQAMTALTQSMRLLENSRWHWPLFVIGWGGGAWLAVIYRTTMTPSFLAPRYDALVVFIVGLFSLLFVVPQVQRGDARRRAHALFEKKLVEERGARQLVEARMAALQGQIEPHFLYNTLANVRTLIRQDADSAENMLNHLNAYLRAAMPDLRSATTLGQELERAEAYLAIMQIRLGARLRFRIEASDQARRCPIPPLVVMTLVENALEHGIEPHPAGGEVIINAQCTLELLTIIVQDNGAGMQSEIGSGIGLLNLQERLQTLYGDAGTLMIEPLAPHGVKASISLPLQQENPA